MDSQPGNSTEANKGNTKRVWNVKEDDALVSCVSALRVDQKYMINNLFKPGYLTVLEAMMEEKIPGCGIKPLDIHYRLKKLKFMGKILQ